MSNYENATMNYCEIGEALENFSYGGYVKMYFPSLTPFSTKNGKETGLKTINTSNIMNRDISLLNIEKVTNKNYLSIYIPPELYRFKQKCPELLPYKGSKGEQFLIAFIGGDINKPIAVRRI